MYICRMRHKEKTAPASPHFLSPPSLPIPELFQNFAPSGTSDNSSGTDRPTRRFELESGSELSAAETVIFLGPSGSRTASPASTTSEFAGGRVPSETAKINLLRSDLRAAFRLDEAEKARGLTSLYHRYFCLLPQAAVASITRNLELHF